jgi:SAM-dependent methyltransferase
LSDAALGRIDGPMWSDVIDLRDFYQSDLGRVAQRMIRGQIRSLWPSLRGQRVLGLGFATPYLRLLQQDALKVIAVMPASQGVLSSSPTEGSLVCLSDEAELPLADRSIDRVLLVHALESTERANATLREIWRVLADGGRLLVVTPNRHGIWARLERTPFGQGRPYAPSQLHRLLRETMFTPEATATALFVPPFRSRMVLRSAPAWENLGNRWFPTFAGVLLVEAGKQIYAGTLVQARARATRVYLPVRPALR